MIDQKKSSFLLKTDRLSENFYEIYPYYQSDVKQGNVIKYDRMS